MLQLVATHCKSNVFSICTPIADGLRPLNRTTSLQSVSQLSAVPTPLIRSQLSSRRPQHLYYHSRKTFSSAIITDPDTSDRLTHQEAAKLIMQNGLIKNEVAYDVFMKMDPANFISSEEYEATVEELNTVTPEVQERSETSPPKSAAPPSHAPKQSSETSSSPNIDYEYDPTVEETPESVFMDNWLHSALTVIGILSILDGTVVPGAKVMDLACGNGYMTACLAEMVKPNGKVRAVDTSDEKLRRARKTLETHYPDLVDVVSFENKDVFSVSEGGPYDAIVVSGGVSEVPKQWLNLVKRDGCLIAATPEIEPVSKETQYMLRKFWVKEDGSLLPINMMFVNYEPLIEPKL